MEQAITQLFVKFIKNRCQKGDLEEVKRILKLGAHSEEWLEAMKYCETEEEGDAVLSTEHQDNLLNRIKLRLHPEKRQLLLRWKWLSAAAIFIILSAAAIVFSYQRTKLAVNRAVIAKVKAVQKPSDHRWLKLADGTSVQLNDSSKLNYPERFAGKPEREVWLEGEAYFDVKHDAKHPFIIHVGAIKVTVLGTAFNIKAYDAHKAVTITVTRGKVKVEDKKRTLAVLTPNEQLTWSASSIRPPKMARVDAGAIVSWKKSDLIMDNVTMEEAVALIAERYHLDVKFKNDHVKKCRFTAAFLNRNSLDQVLEVLKSITGASLVVRDEVLIIDGSGC